MRWSDLPVPKHQKGEERIREGFLLIPRLIGTEWRWLEHAKWHETWRFDPAANSECDESGWERDYWIDDEGERQ